MTVESFDNKARIVRDDLTARLSTGDRLSVASAYFSIYAYQELEKQLDGLDEFRFIYTSPTFLGSKGNKEQREFYIPRLNRERSLYGTQFEIKLRNELTQRTIARECADWIRRKARFKSFHSEQSMERIDTATPDLTQENIDKIAELFPDVVTEAIGDDGELRRAVDFDALRGDLADEVVDGQRERYQFTWPGKAAAKREARTPCDKTLRPCIEESKDWDTTQNLYIEGDNLDALKLLRETYAGKVRLIYIDPPYNTGHARNRRVPLSAGRRGEPYEAARRRHRAQEDERVGHGAQGGRTLRRGG